MTGETIQNRVDLTNQLLEDMISGEIIRPSTGEHRNGLTFVIAKKWGSWYPTYFKTQGGCYAFLTRDPTKEPKTNAGVIVIDPGMFFGENLRKYFNIEPHDIRTVLVSHYHPDHTTGLFELLTLTHESKHSCDYYLNETSFEAFKSFQGKHNKIIELPARQGIRLADYPYGERIPGSSEYSHNERISVRTIPTFHEEIGERHKSLGFIFNVESYNHTCRILLLGDTDGNVCYHDRYLQYLDQADIAILHLGAFTEKGYGKGDKHLYSGGVLNIMNCINCARQGKAFVLEGRIKECIDRGIVRIDSEQKINRVPKSKLRECCGPEHFENLKLVIVSELGLDVASMGQLLRSVKGLRWNSKTYPTLLFAKFLNDNDDYINGFEEKTANISMSKEEKLRVHNILFASTAFNSIKDIVSKSTLDTVQAVGLYDASIFIGSFLCYLLGNKLPEDYWRKELPGAREISDPEKVKKALSKLDKIVDANHCLPDKFTFTDFLSDVKIPGSEFTEAFEKIIRDFIRKIGTSVYNVPPRVVLEKIKDFSEKIFDSVRKVESMKTKHDSALKMSDFCGHLTFAKSISLFDEETCTAIKGLFDKGTIDFRSFCYFLSYEIHEQSKHLESNETDSMKEEHRSNMSADTIIGKDLLELLKKYSDGSQVKYLLSDVGLELNLSTDDLLIRKNRDEWISIGTARQYFDDKGNLQIDGTP